MKKLSKKFTVNLCLLLALCMTLGNVVTAYAGNPEYVEGVSEDNMRQEGINKDAPEYTDNETSDASSVEEMNKYVDVAEKAAEAAEKAAEKAQTAKETVETKVSDANDYVEDADEAVSSATGAAAAAGNIVSTTSGNALDLNAAVGDYNEAVADANKTVSGAAAGLTEVAGSVTNAAETAANNAAIYKEAALSSLEKALKAEDDQTKLDAAEEAREAADAAVVEVKKAEEVVASAEKALQDAKTLYDKYAMIYGLPLYGKDSITYSADDVQKAGYALKAEEVTDAQNSMASTYAAINAASVSDQLQAVEDAKTDLKSAKDSYDDAVKSAKSALDSAKEAAEVAGSKYDLAEGASDSVYNYYITPAEEALEITEAALSANEKELDSAKKTQRDKQEAYDAVLNEYKANYENTYNNDKAAAWKDYESIHVYGVVTALLKEAAKEKWESIVLSDYMEDAEEAAQETSEYNALVQAESKVTALSSENKRLKEQKRQEDEILANVSADAAEYVKGLEEATSTARTQMVNAVKTLISQNSDGINQVQLDQAMNEWANEFALDTTLGFWTQDYKDAKAIREALDEKYNETYWKQFFNGYGLTQWFINTDSLNAAMESVIAGYRENLKKLEEQKATMEAKIAELNALASKNDAASDAAIAIEKYESLKTINESADSLVNQAEQNVKTAETTLAEIKEQATDWYKLDSVDLTELLNKINAAELAVEDANKALDVAKAAKEDAERYATYAANYSEYAKADGKYQMGTAFVYLVRDDEGKTVDAAVNDYDLNDQDVSSRPVSGFRQASDLKGIVVPEEIYRAYLQAIVDHERDASTGIEDKNGKGISKGGSMPLIYWELDENHNLTGKYYTSTTEMVTGTYFIGYSFKKEGDMSTKGYHLDGIMYDYTAPEPDPTPGTTPTEPGTNPTPTEPGTNPTPGTTPTPTPVVPTTPTGENPTGDDEIVDDNVVIDDTTSENPPVVLDLDDEEGTPEGSAVVEDEKASDEKASDDQNSDDKSISDKNPADDQSTMDITEEETALGTAVESADEDGEQADTASPLAQTGTASVYLFYVIAAAFLVLAFYLKRSFVRKEN